MRLSHCGASADALMTAAIAWGRQQHLARLLLDVGDENVPAIALYGRHGFQPTGELGTLPAPRTHVTEHRRCRVLE